MGKSIYEDLGIDSTKAGVAEIFKKITDNDFPGAFCKIIIDPDNPDMVFVKHPDGSASKSVQRILHYLETGDATVLQDDPFDAFSMNTGDIAACGFVFGLLTVTDIIGINALNVHKNVILTNFVLGMAKVLSLYKEYGFRIKYPGGETADLPDQINSYVLDMDIHARANIKEVIKGNIELGDEIFGFASDGQAVWEKKPNSGIMDNGLTMGRIILMHPDYAKKYPFLCRRDKPYCGRLRVNDYLPYLDMTASEALLSPTRQWAILIRLLIEELNAQGVFHLLHGICMNTGGGLTKIRNIGCKIHYIKNIPVPPPLFQLIQQESGESWRNMFKTFNCGIGLEVVGSREGGILEGIINRVSKETNIAAKKIGWCEGSCFEKNSVQLTSCYGTFSDYHEEWK